MLFAVGLLELGLTQQLCGVTSEGQASLVPFHPEGFCCSSLFPLYPSQEGIGAVCASTSPMIYFLPLASPLSPPSCGSVE